MVVARIRKNFEQLFMPNQAIQDDYSVQMQRNNFKKFSKVFILYILIQVVWSINHYVTHKWFNQHLKWSNQNSNDEWLILAMWKGSREIKKWVESECTLHRWPRS